MVLCLLETVSFDGSLVFECRVNIYICGGVGLMVLKVAVKDIETNVDRE